MVRFGFDGWFAWVDLFIIVGLVAGLVICWLLFMVADLRVGWVLAICVAA